MSRARCQSPRTEAVDGPHRGDTGIGNQNVQPAIGAAHFLESLGHLLLGGHVHRKGHSSARSIGSDYIRGYVPAALGIHIGDRNMGSLRRQPEGYRLADAIGSAGDQRHPAGQLLFRRSQS